MVSRTNGGANVLKEQGLARPEIERRIQVIARHDRRVEVDRWNRVLTSASPRFNTQPKAFVVQMTQGGTPGKALGVGMGQGRNALYLAAHGWTVTGLLPDRPVRRRRGRGDFGLQKTRVVRLAAQKP